MIRDRRPARQLPLVLALSLAAAVLAYAPAGPPVSEAPAAAATVPGVAGPAAAPETVEEPVVTAGGMPAPFRGPTILDEDTDQTWEADTSFLSLPRDSTDVVHTFAWSASDGTTGSEESFTHRFTEPGDASLALAIEAGTVTSSAALEAAAPAGATAIGARPGEAGNGTAIARVAGVRALKVRDITPPELVVALAEGRIEVREGEPRDVPPPKTALVRTSGSFRPATERRVPYSPIECGRYRIEKDRSFDVSLRTTDNSGPPSSAWQLQLRGGAVGALTEAGGRVEVLEANYPVGSVDYRFTAQSVDLYGNETVVVADVEVRDPELPEVPMLVSYPDTIVQDAPFELAIECDVVAGEAGDPVPASLEAVTRGFSNPTWGAAVEVERALIEGADVSEAVRDGEPIETRAAAVRQVWREPGTNRVIVELRLLEPGPVRFEIWLRRIFNSEQRIGRSGQLDRTELYVKARCTFELVARPGPPSGGPRPPRSE